jgi:hypothetical protein
MDANVDRFYNLLPAIYRQRDAELGWQLQALLRVLAEQANAVEADIAQLYNNWFIETCQDWVVPYIGDLVDYQLVREAGEPGDVNTVQGRQLNKILIARRDVANTIRARRRKGTLSLLEDLARDVAGWPYAHAVEFYKLLGMTQSMNYTQPGRGRTVSLREAGALKHVGGPFAQEAHTPDVHRIISQQSPGRYNLPSVGLFIWRLKVYPLTRTRARHMREVRDNCYTFSPLGNDTQLFTSPQPRGKTVDALNFPAPINRQAFKDRRDDYYGPGKSMQIWRVDAPEPTEDERHERREQHGRRGEHGQHEQHIHGEQSHGHGAPQQGQPQHGGHGQQHGAQSSGQQAQHAGHEQRDAHAHENQPVQGEHTTGTAPGHAEGARPPGGASSTADQVTITPIDAQHIIPAHLGGWHYHPQPGYVAVDPVLGRIVFPEGHQPREVLVSYYYGFSDDMGGGEYQRKLFQPHVFQPYYVGHQIDTAQVHNGYRTLHEAIAAWNSWKSDHPDDPWHAIIEFVDSGVYNEQLDIYLEEGESLQIRAANHTRPVIRIVDWREDLPDVFRVKGELGSRFTLDGLLITGSPVECRGDIADLTIRHCTLVPGLGLHSSCEPQRPEQPSLVLLNIGKQVTIEHSILGSILVEEEEEEDEDEEAQREDPLPISITDSILDATDPEQDIISAEDQRIAYAALTIARCTVFGRVRVHSLELAENSIFTGVIRVARRQHGCMRFCSLASPGQEAPRTSPREDESEEDESTEEEHRPTNRTPRRYHCQPDLVEQALHAEPQFKALPPEERKKLEQLERDRIRPLFNSTRYGMATYCQLAHACAQEVKSGADDQSEMGVFHELYQPQRETNLRTRLDDYTPAGMQTGIIYVELYQTRRQDDTPEGTETGIVYRRA